MTCHSWSIASWARSRRAALELRLVLHPIFKIRRSATGTLQAIVGAGDRAWGDGAQESYISVHVDPLSETAARELVAALSQILDGVRIAVADWQPMLERARKAIRDLEANPPDIPQDLHAESIAFIEWLMDGHFTFLGTRDFRLQGDVQQGELIAVEGAGLGLLRDPTVQVLRRGTELVAMTAEVRRFFFEPASLIITKSNVVSRIHRRAHMDYIGVKLYGADRRPAGELRIVGLFTSSAYTQSPRQIPILRHKLERVLQSSGHPPESHAGKSLINVLETFPRDELFQITPEDLSRWTAGIVDLELRPRVRVFARVDRFDRFVSVLLFVPRDGYSRQRTRADRQLPSRSLQRSRHCILPVFHGWAAGARAVHHRPPGRADSERRCSRTRARNCRASCAPGRISSRSCWPSTVTTRKL